MISSSRGAAARRSLTRTALPANFQNAYHIQSRGERKKILAGRFSLAMPGGGSYSDRSEERKRARREEIQELQALGRHLLLELFDCDADAISSLEIVKTSMVEAARRVQATIVDVVFHEFNPFGISGVVVIAESHLAIHTWPEHRYAAVDVFSCGRVLQPEVAADYLVERFGAARASVVELQRGILMDASLAARPRPVAARAAPAGARTRPVSAKAGPAKRTVVVADVTSVALPR
jgi:S-adenosylmethionine decarboxylase